MNYEKPKIETISARRLVENLGPAQAGGYGGSGGNSVSPSSAVGGGGGSHIQRI